jgi:cysteine desulfurase/selenocysteine lyase
MSPASNSPVRDLARFRADFPILRREINGRPLIYLDSAATALKPQCVIDAVVTFYTHYTANVHRAVHALSEEATEAFEGAREKVARFIGADTREIVFVRHATEAVNLVANSLPENCLVAVPVSEHHSNLLPWRRGRFVLLDALPTGEVDLDRARRVLRETKPALLTFSTVNNALGTRQPLTELTRLAREVGAKIMLDVSQSVGHEPVDVMALDCDFLCFSGHKMLGPSGLGVLYQKEKNGLSLKSLLLGGSMVREVHADSHAALEDPWGLEPGTPNIEGAIGLGAACDYLDRVGVESIHAHVAALTAMARAGLAEIPSVRLNGTDASRGSIVSFHIPKLAAHGIARMLSNRFSIMVRSGYHCAQPLHEACGIPESVRLSVHLYNSADEIQGCLAAVKTVANIN